MDPHGWCDKNDGVGCPIGESYEAGICSEEPVPKRNLAFYPAGPKKCHQTCLTCTDLSEFDCLSCPSFMGLRLNSGLGTCEPCDPLPGNDICLKCDASVSVCEVPYTKPDCGADKCQLGECEANGF